MSIGEVRRDLYAISGEVDDISDPISQVRSKFQEVGRTLGAMAAAAEQLREELPGLERNLQEISLTHRSMHIRYGEELGRLVRVIGADPSPRYEMLIRQLADLAEITDPAALPVFEDISQTLGAVIAQTADALQGMRAGTNQFVEANDTIRVANTTAALQIRDAADDL